MARVVLSLRFIASKRESPILKGGLRRLSKVTTTTQRIRQLILSAAIALVSVVGVQTLAGAAPVEVTGTAGKAAQRASINFKAVAREEAFGPMPLNEHRKIHRPFVTTDRKHHRE